ncbi:putative Acyl-CoA N-acyltransferase with RING/FYVE/PHD-type zinc finger protein [Quillaja saponaria]|uniref:Acyl-CoA N-acyltransferase with RING/FYVE/PHD-type zinc finger protein n=1 Tax=Quillaja saponaria TaxID=32244 RepID=A0AAD7VLD5_QUISA|nr:putative Acyl-CoA N-acyltransferase with RING/FYVE/PHD-type zinc finger protein [Quillaja saponaria]
MDGGMRSAGLPGVMVKNRNSSGCLIVRKKGDGVGGGVGSSSSRKMLSTKKEKKRASMVFSDSGSSDELLMPPRRRVAPETIRVCNGLTAFERDVVEESGIDRKRDRLEQIRHNEDGIIGNNGLDDRERKRAKLDVFEFDEYDGNDREKVRRRHFDDGGVDFGRGRFPGSMHVGQSGIEREFETGSSRHIVDKRKNSYYDRTNGMSPGDNIDQRRFKMNRDGTQVPPSMFREKFMGNSDESIRVQGKNGVLKVMLNKKKMGGPLEHFDHRRAVESRKSLRTDDTLKRNVLIHPSSYSGSEVVEKPGLIARAEKKKVTSRKSLSSKDSKGGEWDSENSDTSLKPGMKNVEAHKSIKRASSEDEQIPLREKRSTIRMKEGKVRRGRASSEDERTPFHEKLSSTGMKEGKGRRGSGTEKQKLREKIRGMLLSAGWTIDYRPRRNRDYLDAVYINPGGTAYWSIIKAYDALQKQLNEDENEAKPSGDGSSLVPIADEVLSQLTRKTRKKIEEEMKRKQRDASDSDSAKETRIKRPLSAKHDMENVDSDSQEEKLSSFIKLSNKSLRSRMVENGVVNVNSNCQNSPRQFNDGTEKPSAGGDSRLLHGRKSRKHGRCTLLVRNKGLNSETDGFVPYTGKRTVLSWLIDCGTVQLSQKVQYRRRKRVMLEGWITRDGIHCRCCSKILTVSKFEIHAGSKLRQPFHNIYLDTGTSLLQCQIDAWNRQEDSVQIGFHSVDIDGDDPNDDTCGICGDGGDLICCDSCPSTFHQICLDIQMLPPGEWHCPNCTCKFCAIASGTLDEQDDTTVFALHTCKLCEKKYHESCIKNMDALPVDSKFAGPSFCGKDCKELFEDLKKYLGAKHELEAGFSWSLIHRTDEDAEAASRGISQRVECNSKLAVALTVMDECFLPIVDRRSGISLIHNVLYNSGSNFYRLNYSGFYTAILERGDEIISAASIRFHGTKLAEMPFIGTRHVYRRQGMCRRLFSAIESALCSLKVEKLVIPAIADLMHTWTGVFGFTPLDESLKHEMRSMNMLVFPGTDMLEKLIVEQGKLEGNITDTGENQMEDGDKHFINYDMDSSAGQYPHGCEDAGSHPVSGIPDEVGTSDSDSQSVGGSTNDISVVSSSLCASHEMNNQVSIEGTKCSECHSGEKLAEAASDRKCMSPSSPSHRTLKMENKLVLDTPVKDNLHSSPQCLGGSLNDTSVISHSVGTSQDLDVPVLIEETVCLHSEDKLIESAPDRKCQSPSSFSHDVLDVEINPVSESHVVNDVQSFKEADTDDSREVNEAVPFSGKLPSDIITKEINKNEDVSGSIPNGVDESSLQSNSDLSNKIALEAETKLQAGSEVASDLTPCEELHAAADASEIDVL